MCQCCVHNLFLLLPSGSKTSYCWFKPYFGIEGSSIIQCCCNLTSIFCTRIGCGNLKKSSQMFKLTSSRTVCIQRGCFKSIFKLRQAVNSSPNFHSLFHVYTYAAGIAGPYKLFMGLSSYPFKRNIFKAAVVYNLWNMIIYFCKPPEGETVKDSCVHIYLCVVCAYSFVWSSFMYPSETYTLQNSSSRLLITKILCSLISCRFFSLLFPVISFPPWCSSSQPLVIIGLH